MCDVLKPRTSRKTIYENKLQKKEKSGTKQNTTANVRGRFRQDFKTSKSAISNLREDAVVSPIQANRRTFNGLYTRVFTE